MGAIAGLAHVNLIVPVGTLEQADQFYAGVSGLTKVEAPVLQRDRLSWFDITPNGQQIHIAASSALVEPRSHRHPCFKIGSLEEMLALQKKVYEHQVAGGNAAVLEADKPGGENSGVEYPSRFFARDYAGNRLEISL
ncbi:putative glyoxalase family protein [Amylocarpus encephaloides]|uniref:Glyoxalase family protein n=1 Tax=Amylocarpus encephaloides TaxID=45428 RepID=A0A9P7Y8R3_9HELO|nr:putative glyoxalase family protein [Amylocarpus encephaloides]